MVIIFIAIIAVSSAQAVDAPGPNTPTVTPVIETPVATTTKKVVARPLSNAEYELIVQNAALKYGVSAATMQRIINCENRGLIPDQQSGHYYKPNNRWGFSTTTREKSFGLVQIHLPDHPYVSYTQAIDPEFSIDFLAKNIALGNATWWSCY